MALLPGQAAAPAMNADEEMGLTDVESPRAVQWAEHSPSASVPPPLEVVADTKPMLDAYTPKAVARESSLLASPEKAKKGTVKKKHNFTENAWDVFLSYRVAADQALVSAAPMAKRHLLCG